MSQDPTYLKIYGGESVHDIYIYVGAHIDAYKDMFLEHYDLDSPTKEGVAYIKEHYNEARQVCKVCHLSMQYGASAGKVFQILTSQGVDVSFFEVEKLHKQYWGLFSKVKLYQEQLLNQWATNGGYIITTRGVPHWIRREDTKDILNRMIQTSCHLLLQRWLFHVRRIREERKVDMTPFIADLHDAQYWTCPIGAEEETEAVIQDALVRLNEEIQLSVTIKGKTKFGKSFGEVS